MAYTPPAAVVTSALLIGAGLTLGGCGSTTYGTGTTVAAQTVKDVTGILSLGTKKSGPTIDYEPRAPIVEPPADTLPPPGDDTTVATANSDWPVDPDVEKKRIEALVKERTDAGEPVKFTMPGSGTSDRKPVVPKEEYRSLGDKYMAQRLANSTNSKDIKKQFANAKKAKSGCFDENGNPVRAYLIQPPATYCEPDSASPVDVTESPKKKKKFKWPHLWPF